MENLINKIVKLGSDKTRASWLVTKVEGDTLSAISIDKRYYLAVCRCKTVSISDVVEVDEVRSAKWLTIKAKRAAK
jgi:hypothetical protein